MSASVNLPLHHESRSSLLVLAHPGGPRKRAIKRLWCGVVVIPVMVVCSTISSLSNPQYVRNLAIMLLDIHIYHGINCCCGITCILVQWHHVPNGNGKI